MPLDSKNGRRLLFAAGTAYYDHLPSYAVLDKITTEVQQISDLFSRFGYQRYLEELSLNPSISALRENLPVWFQTHKEDDIVIFYYTSHGANDEERYYLLTSDSNDAILDTTSMPAEDLARWISKNSCAKQFLVILDACYSGRGATDFLAVVGKVVSAIGSKGAVFVIAAARPKEEAAQGALSSALEAALANADGRLGGVTQQFLSFEDVMESVDGFLRGHTPFQTATWSSANVRGRSRFFPNPRFQPQMHPGLDLETLRSLREHWIPKAMGAEVETGGWYFTGRRAALEEIVGWLTGDLTDARTRVVTGGPGSGKSALIARIVTLSNPATRAKALSSGTHAQTATIPSEKVINVAIHARRKTLLDIVRLVGEPLGIAASSSGELITSLEIRQGKTVIVLDALDEADNYHEVVSQLLKPLDALPNVFLLIGTRPDSTDSCRRFRSLGESTVEIDLDQSCYFDSRDIELYVERRLHCEEEPNRPTLYRERPELAHALARGIAQRSGKVFLIARTVVQSLIAANKPVDTSMPTWMDALPAGIEAAFGQFLAEFDISVDRNISSEMVRAVLRPLAYAEGEGLPWAGIWSQVATALSLIPVTDDDIVQVLNRAAPFVVEALEAEQSVYRLYHEEFARYMQAQVLEADAERNFVQALLALIPMENGQPLWDRVHQHYLITHLSTHAAKVPGLLDTMIADPRYLGRADPDRLLVAINRSEGEPHCSEVAQEMRAIYRLGHHHLRRTLDPEERVAYLELIAHAQGAHQAMNAFGQLDLQTPWRVRWARSRPKSIHVTLEGHTKEVTALAVGGLMDGRRVIVSGSMDNTVRVWDLETGAPIGPPIEGHTDNVSAVAVGEYRNGRRVIVSGSMDNTVRVWDLDTGEPIGPPIEGHTSSVYAVAIGERRDGRRVIVSGSLYDTVRVWDLETGEPIGPPIEGHTHGIAAVAIGEHRDGRRVIVSGSADHTVRVWDLETGAPIGTPFEGHTSFVSAVAVAEHRDERRVIVSASGDKTLQVWDIESGAPIGPPLEGHMSRVNTIAVGERRDGRRVIVSGSMDNTVRVWDLETGAPIGIPHEGPTSDVSAAVFGERTDGRRVIVSGNSDHTVRVWDLDTGAPIGAPLEGHTLSVTAVAVGERSDGRRVIVSGSGDHTVRVWDLDTGVPLGTHLERHTSYVTAVAVGERSDGRRVIVSGSYDQTMRVLDLDTGAPICTPYEGCTSSVSAAAFGERSDGRRVIVSGSSDHTVRVWDLDIGSPIGAPLKGHTLFVGAVAVGERSDGRRVIVSGSWDKTVRVWDLDTGASIGGPLEGHTDSVCAVAVGERSDGRRVIVSGSRDDTVRVWDLENNELLAVINVSAYFVNLRGGTLVLVNDNDFFSLRI